MQLYQIAAMCGIRLEDVAVTNFQLFQNTALVDYTGSAVVGKANQKKSPN